MIIYNNLPEISVSANHLNIWLNAIGKAYACQIKNLSYTFLSNDEIHRINRQFLEHDYPTDIITFGYGKGCIIEGDVYIGLDVVRENALRFDVDYSEELLRVVAHGLLHLVGFKDGSEDEKAAMRQEEENCLILRSKILKVN